MSEGRQAAARLRLRAGIGGEPIVEEAEHSPAHAFEPAPFGAWLVGSAGHPVGGDQLGIQVTVGVGCCAEIRSYSPTVARRGRAGSGASSTRLRVSVGNDAMLTWVPEPAIASGGCDHLSDCAVQLASNARLLWRDELLLDRREGESDGTWRARIRVTRDSWPVLCTELALGPASQLWRSPVALRGARALSMAVAVDPGRGGWSPARTVVGSASGVALPLSAPGAQLLAWGDDLLDCRAAIEKLMAECGAPEWVNARWTGAPGPVVPGGDAGLFGLDSSPAGPNWAADPFS